jgi:hypothetical protein
VYAALSFASSHKLLVSEALSCTSATSVCGLKLVVPVKAAPAAQAALALASLWNLQNAVPLCFPDTCV